MRHTHLGRTGRSGLTVSRPCLGTMNFGPETDEATSFAIMDSALDAGINFVDAAYVYGRSNRRGGRPDDERHHLVGLGELSALFVGASRPLYYRVTFSQT